MSHERNGSSGNLSANSPLEHKPELTIGSIVRIYCGDSARSHSAFKKRIGKVLKLEVIAGYTFALVEISMRNSLIEYSCLTDNLEVVG